jgi:phage terminase small subunit
MGQEKPNTKGSQDKRGLEPRQERFVQEYLIDLNATQAAIRAGYSEKTASSQGQRLLTNVEVRNLIDAALAEREVRSSVKADRVLAELARLGLSNIADYITVQEDGSAVVDLSRATREQLAAVQEITVDELTDGKGEGARPVKRIRLKLAPKTPALELLAKHLNLLREVGSKDNPLTVDAGLASDAEARIAAAIAKLVKRGQ